ncbi:hypothetical protein SNEBB_004808 [Seison nebaliae]|nr:hypothetical protein SNEBB_004808 [Seison nebaliae]
MEETILLRLSEEDGNKLNEKFEKNEEIPIDLKLMVDEFEGRLTLNGNVIDLNIVDLPCIIDVMKTNDNKMLHKTGNISQMLIEKDEMTNELQHYSKVKTMKAKSAIRHMQNDGTTTLMKKTKKQLYEYPHGINPPLKQVKSRRFRKVIEKVNMIDYQEIEKEIQRLIKSDLKAWSSSYTLTERTPSPISTPSPEKGEESDKNDEKMKGESPSDEHSPNYQSSEGSSLDFSLSDDDDEESDQERDQAQPDVEMDDDPISDHSDSDQDDCDDIFGGFFGGDHPPKIE